jgi:putative Holliday junction resolvase
LAVSDPDGLLASPVATVIRDRRGADLARIAELTAESGAVEVVVGLPRSLSGAEGPAAAAAVEYADRLARRIAPIPVRLVDERLSTVTAEAGLRAAGVPGRRRRRLVDQAAAVIILQSALDAERASGRPPGRTVQPDPGGGT